MGVVVTNIYHQHACAREGFVCLHPLLEMATFFKEHRIIMCVRDNREQNHHKV